MDVSIIIINYNTKLLTSQCIESIIAQTNNVLYEIIVVDNNSTDDSQTHIKAKFPDVILVENHQNFGFGKANNIGAKYAKGKYIFFLNSDCILLENTVEIFFQYMKSNINEQIGIVGTMLYDREMNINQSYFKFPTISNESRIMFLSLINKLLFTKRTLPQRHNYINNLKKENCVDFLSGADLFILKETFIKLKGFDEEFFLYYEETDLQKRMSKKGLKRILLNKGSIIHLEGQSSSNSNFDIKTFLIYLDSKSKYYKKHNTLISYYFFNLFFIFYYTMFIFRNKLNSDDKKKLLKLLLKKSTLFDMLDKYYNNN